MHNTTSLTASPLIKVVETSVKGEYSWLCDKISYLRAGKNLVSGFCCPFSQISEITWQPFVHSEVFHFNSLKLDSLKKPLTATVPAEWWTDQLQWTQKPQLLLSLLQCDFSYVISLQQIWTNKTGFFLFVCLVTTTHDLKWF